MERKNQSELYSGVLLKIAQGRSHSTNGHVKSNFTLSRSSIKNALKHDKSMDTSKRLKIMQEYERFSKNNQSAVDKAAIDLNRSIMSVKELAKSNIFTQKHKKVIRMKKRPKKFSIDIAKAENSMKLPKLGSHKTSSKFKLGKSPMLNNVEKFLFPELNQISRTASNKSLASNKSYCVSIDNSLLGI